MIEKIQITNFQSHKDTTLKLHPGVNVIVGTSDSGKSAILRALRWLVWNRPLGDAFRSHWGGDTSVVLHAQDTVVERFKGKGGDRYTLAEEDRAEPIEFKAFGTDTPEDVALALNLSELNIQSQHDSSFLLSSNPGEVSRHFNRIAKIDQIDSGLKAVESLIRDVKQNTRFTESEIQRYTEALKAFTYLDKMEIDVEVLEGLDARRLQAEKQHSSLNALITRLEETDTQITEASTLLPAEAEVDRLLQLKTDRQEVLQKGKALKALIVELDEVTDSIEDYHELMEDEGLINSILNLYNTHKQTSNTQTQLNKLVCSIEQVTDKIQTLGTTLTKLEEEWHESMPEICPLCGK